MGVLQMCNPTSAGISEAFDAYNVVWDSPSKNSSESMPVGGHSIGLNVWVENGDVLFYMQRSGSLSENGEYLKLGRMRLRLQPNPFENGSAYRQELNLRESTVEIEGSRTDEGKNIKACVRVWVEIDEPVVHVDIDSETPIKVSAFYENWRTNDVELTDGQYGGRFGCFSLAGYPGKVVRHGDSVKHADRGVLFFHRNPDDKLIPDLLIKQQGLEDYADEIYDDLKHRTFGGILQGEGFVPDGTEDGKYLLTPYRAWKLRSEQASRKHRLQVVTHIAQEPDQAAWEAHLSARAAKAAGNQVEARARMLAWWDAFWKRSWIVPRMEAGDRDSRVWRAGRNYQLFRYQLGCNSRGEYPSKFNGGSFTFDSSLVKSGKKFGPDWRQWGGAVHTAQNQRLVYWPMLKAGDADMMKPQFELYRKGLPAARARVKEHFGHAGAVFSEYASATGLALGAGWGWQGKRRGRGAEIPFGDPRADATKSYGAPVEKGVMANGAISYHWESQVEHAYMLLEANRFTGMDISAYLPFIRESLIFFDEHYQKRRVMRDKEPLDENGKLVIFPSTSCESYRGATNPSDLVAGLSACIESILAQKIGTDADRSYFEGLRKRVPELAFGKAKNGARIILPAASHKRYGNCECPQFYPLFPFNRFALGRDDMKVFQDSWTYGTFPKNMVQSWHQDGIFFARMGLTKEAADYNLKKLADSPRRFPTFWGPGHDWVPDHNWGGTGMLGLQEMLMQTIGDSIRLLPAWPDDWDVDFKLHAPMRTTVEARVRDGKIVELKVDPPERKKDVVIMGGRSELLTYLAPKLRFLGPFWSLLGRVFCLPTRARVRAREKRKSKWETARSDDAVSGGTKGVCPEFRRSE